MARIGVLPTKTAIELREPDGDAGTIPAATATAAGCMTAEHVRMLEQVYAWHQTSGGSSPVIIERQADTSQYLTKLEAQAIIARLPRAIDVSPEVKALRAEMADIKGQIISSALALPSPEPQPGEVVDEVARDVMRGFIAGMEQLDERVRRVEVVLESLRAVAEVKARDAA